MAVDNSILCKSKCYIYDVDVSWNIVCVPCACCSVCFFKEETRYKQVLYQMKGPLPRHDVEMETVTFSSSRGSRGQNQQQLPLREEALPPLPLPPPSDTFPLAPAPPVFVMLWVRIFSTKVRAASVIFLHREKEKRVSWWSF